MIYNQQVLTLLHLDSQLFIEIIKVEFESFFRIFITDFGELLENYLRVVKYRITSLNIGGFTGPVLCY